jgi:hypothetical protein
MRGRRYANRRLCGDPGLLKGAPRGFWDLTAASETKQGYVPRPPKSHEPTKPSSDLPRLLLSACAPPILKLGYYMTAGAGFTDIRVDSGYPDIR